MTCETLPIWRPDEKSPSLSEDCSKDAAARKMYQEVSNSVVEINLGLFGSANGFFVGAGDEVMTNAHVAARFGTEPVHIQAKDGKRYIALLEGADEANDLALLKVQGLEPGTYKPLQFRPSETLKSGEEIYRLGHAGAHNNAPWQFSLSGSIESIFLPGDQERTSVYIAPGAYQGRGALISFYADQQSMSKLEALLKSQNIDDRTRAEQEVYAPRLGTSAKEEPGSSGSPVVDSHGLVIGVHADGVPEPAGSRSLEVPSEPALKLLNPANRTRPFIYEAQTNYFLHPIDALTRQLRLAGDPVRYIPF